MAGAPGRTVIDTEILAQLQAWIGRSESTDDEITAAPLRGLTATLDRDDPNPVAGSVVPPLWHWLYFLPRHRGCDLGPDGHPRRGGFLPPVPLPRRMWAGGQLEWEPDNPLRVGDSARRSSQVVDVRHRRGARSDLVFVSVRHQIDNARGRCLTEDHDIVYLDARPTTPSTASPEQVAPSDPADPHQPSVAVEPSTATRPAVPPGWQRHIVPEDVLLFRYSALTFNGFRIHYDHRYAQAEGYPGLVVHAPLIATLLLDLVTARLPGRPVRRFEMRALAPSYDQVPLTLGGLPSEDGNVDLWAVADGTTVMRATAIMAPRR